MAFACPACRKSIDIQECCPRCGCGLQQLHKLLTAHDTLTTQAGQAFANNNVDEALTKAMLAWRLKHSQTSAKIAFLASCSLRNQNDSIKWYLRVKKFY